MPHDSKNHRESGGGWWVLGFGPNVPALRMINIIAPSNWLVLTPDLGRSDHAPFWIAGDPALMLSGTANFRNPNYHTPNDTLGTINFDFMANVVKASIATLAVEAEIQNSDWVTATINIEITTGIEDIYSKENIIYPNPTQQVFYISSQLDSIESIKITDLTGKVVLTINKPDTVIDISILKSGTYDVFIHSKNKAFLNKLIVVD